MARSRDEACGEEPEPRGAGHNQGIAWAAHEVWTLGVPTCISEAAGGLEVRTVPSTVGTCIPGAAGGLSPLKLGAGRHGGACCGGETCCCCCGGGVACSETTLPSATGV